MSLEELKRTAGCLSALVGMAGPAYLPFLTGGLLTDDFAHLTRQLKLPTLRTLLTTPDSFHFYRPIPQATLWLDAKLFGMNPFAFRLTNLILHIAVVVCAFVLSRLILGRTRAAFLTALAFALTPKAFPIAVLWISARSELLMALFSMMAVLSWLRWERTDRHVWLGAVWLFYTMAFLSKETAILLPVLLLLTPTDSGRTAASRRWLAVLILSATAAAILLVRASVGAVLPNTTDPHYALMMPASRWLRNTEVYAGRMIPSALAMLAIVGGPAAVIAWRRGVSIQGTPHSLHREAIYAITWSAIFIVPVLPIVARSELYLYLPGFGLCLFAGSLTDTMLSIARSGRLEAITLTIYVLLLGGYQISRSAGLHEDLMFSADLMGELRQELRSYSGSVGIIPADVRTSRLLRDSVGGYGDLMLKMASGRYEVNGFIDYDHHEIRPDVLAIECTYLNGDVILRRVLP